MDPFRSLILITVLTSVDFTEGQSDFSSETITEVQSFSFGESLRIVSPNYPESYPNNANIQWLVSGPTGYQVMAVFSAFHLEEGYDNVEIGSGLDSGASVLATFSGSDLPCVTVSSDNEMWLSFVSDSSVTYTGFNVTISVYTPSNSSGIIDSHNVMMTFCDSVLSTSSSPDPEVQSFGFGESLTIVSPNYPDSYPNKANIQWLVSGPTGYRVMAVFNAFHLEERHDHVRIGSGLEYGASVLTTFSGSDLPCITVSSDNEMWLSFVSDSSVTHLGFNVTISVHTPSNFTDIVGNRTYSSSSHDGMNMSFCEEVLSAPGPVFNVFYSETCIEESCFGGGETVVCRCDDICQFFGDCCPDYPVLGKTPSNETSSNETSSNKTLTNETILEGTLLDLNVWKCIDDSFLPQSHPDLQHGYRMVARCPSEWSLDEDVKQKCEEVNPNVTTKVFYIYEDIYFKNLGCATCHGYDESALTSFTISSDQFCMWRNDTLDCFSPVPPLQSNASRNSSESIEDFMITFNYIPKPRLCLLNATETCPNGTDENVSLECQYYQMPIIGDGIIHKHPSCSHCSGGPLLECPFDIIDMRGITIDIGYDPIMPIELDLGIIDIFIHPEPILTIKCTEGFELDPNGNCVQILSDWPVCQSENFTIDQLKGAVDCLADVACFRDIMLDNRSVSLINHQPPCLVKSSTYMDNDTISFSLNYRDYIDPSIDERLIEEDIIRLLQTHRSDDCKNVEISASHSCYVEESTENTTYECPMENMFVGHYSDLLPSLIKNESFIFINGSYIRPTWWSNITTMQLGDANVSFQYQFTMCGSEVALQTCPFLTVSNDSIQWIDQDNRSVMVHEDQMYDIEDILINPDGSINICYDHHVTPRRTLTILGHVLFAISSVCLLATLITYIAFSTLRNRQGVSIMNFIVALFFGQILLQYVRLSVSGLVIPCIVVAVLSHFFFLASFVWTTILAWDLSRSFAASNMKTFSSSSFGGKMIAFLVIGWGTPLLFVFITILLQFGGFQNGPLLEYDSTRCWLATLSSIVMFFVPMSICLLANLVLFIITIHGVHSIKKTTSMLKAGQDSQLKQWAVELRIYIKISALLGFTWLFGFLMMVVRVPFTEYLFIIVSGFQGVFIFLSFGANKRVKKLWRTTMRNSTLWTTLSRRDYSKGQSSSGQHHAGHNT
ncbi:uncharacterized protein LOC121407225 [Lytechinus variegatus]|uniref:uncharacterized protein LOC121407225 n=1 Tax=Lytechinus variegatus TaxID=7654 RepID=UPI001BB205AA|nr:uncharacterized protein LOC121407225 [Lytechinus variegatus]